MNRRQLIATPALALGYPLLAQRETSAQTATPPTGDFTISALPESPPRADGPISMVTTTPILADLVRQVGGIRVDVKSLLPANAGVHDFEPAPEDIVTVEDADIVIEHGMNLDSWAANLVDSAGADRVVIATAGVTAIPSQEKGFEAGDPHVWFDPANVKVMTANISGALSAYDPEGADAYATRLAAYEMILDDLDQWITTQIASIAPERRKLVTNHDAFSYYVNRYGLIFVGSVIPSLDSQAEPSAKEIADLIERIKAEGVAAIFTESSLNPELETELAAQAGIAVIPDLYSDNLGDAASGADTYIGLMVTNTMVIVNALR